MKEEKKEVEEYPATRAIRAIFFIVFGIVLVLLFSLILRVSRVYSKDLYTTNEIWDEVQLVGRYAEDHPVFSDTTNVQATLIKDAYGWLQGVMDGYTYLDKLTLPLTTTDIQYGLEPTGFVNEVLPVKIHAVRRLSTENPQSLFSKSIDDLNKVFDLKVSYPEFYATDWSRIFFNSYPSVVCTAHVWAYRQASTDSACVWGRKPVLLSVFRHILIFRTLALAKQKEGNEVAYRNITAICHSMVARMLDLQRLIEGTKDIKVLPQLYDEE